ncbi:hypothetical protein CKAH01_06586, partial [Colletotrichum kahawae]
AEAKSIAHQTQTETSQRTLNNTLDFIRTNLTTRQAAESMGEEALRNKPTDADIRRLFQETILTREPFTSTHQVMFCTVPLAAKVVTFAFEELLYSPRRACTTKLSIIMTGGIKIGREWNEDVFEKRGRMSFFKNSDEGVPGALLWEAEVGLDVSGRKELKNNTIHVWVPHKPGVGNEDEEAHLGWHYVEWFKECLEVGNKKPRQLSFRYFKDVPFSDEPRVWDTSDNQVNSIAMAMMHLLGGYRRGQAPVLLDRAAVLSHHLPCRASGQDHRIGGMLGR